MKLRFREGFNALQAMVMFAGIAGEWQLGENRLSVSGERWSRAQLVEVNRHNNIPRPGTGGNRFQGNFF